MSERQMRRWGVLVLAGLWSGVLAGTGAVRPGAVELVKDKPFFYALQPGCWSDAFRPLAPDAADGKKLSQTVFGQDNGVTLLNPSWNFPSPTRQPERLSGFIPNRRDICFREIRLLTAAGENVAASASVYSESDGGGLLDLQRLTDDDLALAAVSRQAQINRPQAGFVSFSFLQPQTVARVELFHGRRNGAAWVSLAKDYRLQVNRGHGWSDIPGQVVRGNGEAETVHTFTPVPGLAFRVLVEDQSDLYDYRGFPFSMENRWLDRVAMERMVPPGAPFYWWYLGHTGDLFFGFPAEPQVDLAGFQRWQEHHPNFFGFGLLEWDNDILKSYLPMGRGFDAKHGFVVEKEGQPLTPAYLRASANRVVERELPPAYARDRQELLAQIEAEFRYQNRVLFDSAFTMLSHTTWYHYALEWGAPLFMLESTGGTPNRQLQFAFARGISRQYRKAWGVYYAYFLGGGYLDYLNPPKAVDQNYNRGPDCGISASSHRRQLYLGYLSGAAFFDFEHQDIVPFVRTDHGQYRFSPHGEAMREVLEFARRHPDRGTVHAPFALLLDYAHGWTFWGDDCKVFMGYFPSAPADLMIDRVLYEIFPWDRKSFSEGKGYCMTQTRYGDRFDVLIANPPASGPPAAELLRQYRVLLLLGEIAADAALAARMREYVAAGGTLVLNEMQLSEHFPAEFTGVRRLTGERTGTVTRVVADGRLLEGAGLPYRRRETELCGARSLLADAEGETLLTEYRVGQGRVLVSWQSHLLADAPERPALPTLRYLLQEVCRDDSCPITVEGEVEYIINRNGQGWWLSLLNNRGIYKEGRKPERIDPDGQTTVTVRYAGAPSVWRELISGESLPCRQDAAGTACTLTLPPGQIMILEIPAKP